jgi:hypothetical protein
MDFQLKIEPDPSSVFPKDPRLAFRVTLSAVNRTLATGRTRFARVLREEINLKVADIRAEVKLKKISLADAKNATGAVEGRIEIKQRFIPLIDFPGTRAVKGGVSVLVSKSKGREVMLGAFIAVMKSGHRGVFERKLIIQFSDLSNEEQVHFSAGALHFSKSRLVRRPGADGKKRVARLPIQERVGKSLVGYLANAPGVLTREVAGLQDVLTNNVISQINRFTKRKGTDSFDDLLQTRIPDEAP